VRGLARLPCSLGHLTYLEAKAERDNSMSEKAGCGETVEPQVRRGPDGMVKAGIASTQSVHPKVSGSGKTVETRCGPDIVAVAPRRYTN